MAASSSFVALLRGINVSGKNKIPMKELATVCAELGWESVKTHLQTGNIVFTAQGSTASVETDLEKAIERVFGFSIPVIVRTAADYIDLVTKAPFAEAAATDPSHVLFYFAKDGVPEDAAVTLEARGTAGEVVQVSDDSLWIYFPNGVGFSKLTPAVIDRAVKSSATGRNWNTVTKIRELLSHLK